MDLSIMVATQLSFDFSENYLPDKIQFIVRKRMYDEIPYLRTQVDIEKLYGEIQLINTSLDFSDKDFVIGANTLITTILQEGLIDENRLFFSKKFGGYEVLFTKKMEKIISSLKSLYLINSWSILNSDGARIIECEVA